MKLIVTDMIHLRVRCARLSPSPRMPTADMNPHCSDKSPNTDSKLISAYFMLASVAKPTRQPNEVAIGPPQAGPIKNE